MSTLSNWDLWCNSPSQGHTVIPPQLEQGPLAGELSRREEEHMWSVQVQSRRLSTR